MKRTSSRQITAFYALIQALYWITYGLMFNYAAVYLQSRGFSSGGIGLVLGASYLLSALGQPLFARLVSRRGLRLNVAAAGVYLLMAALSALILLLPLKGAVLAVIIVAAFTLQSAMQPSINSLHWGFELSGTHVNFGLARGVGSAGFALSSLLMGQILRRAAPDILPACYLAGQILLALCLTALRAPDYAHSGQSKRGGSYRDILAAHPKFALFLGGVACMSMAHIFIDNFMLQIMQSLGGGSANLGVAIGIAGMTELPAMVLYSRLSRRMDGFRLLRIAAWIWLAKDVLTLLATSPSLVYVSEALQFFSYAIYVPAAVDYIARALPAGEFLGGQALHGSFWTLGSLAATFLGGQLIDGLGVRGALGIAQLFALGGAVLISLSTARRVQAQQ